MKKKRYIKNVVEESASSFDGKLLGQIGTEILVFFAFLLPLLPVGGLAVLALTLFADLNPTMLLVVYSAIGVFGFFMLWLGAAWSTVIFLRWQYRHTIINDKRLVFKGKTVALWGNYLKWFFLTVLTLSIYGLWVWIKMQKWIIKNVETEELEEAEVVEQIAVEQIAVSPCLPATPPLFPPYPSYPPCMPQPQMPIANFSSCPYIPPYPHCPYANRQNKKKKNMY